MHFDDYTRCASTQAYRAKFFKLLDAAITQLRGNPPPQKKTYNSPRQRAAKWCALNLLRDNELQIITETCF